MAPQDDFSFPTITNTPPCFIESPPLWRTTSIASGPLEKNPRNDHIIASTKKEVDHEEKFDMSPLISNKSNYINQRKSFSYIEGAAAMKRMIEDEQSHNHEEEVEEEEEEEEEEKMDMLWENFNEESNQIMTRCCENDTKKGQALSLSRASKRPSLVVLIKVLKKVFLLHASPTSFNKAKL
ncbi:PREDICTED: uncharacterized protein LOC109242573 [Nicotiana attenuata]|uniref:Uncharacterized protein n=1 Tax=Nicotiana attenuata TaxID=49451 RepID=A0A314L3A3_NICAT|nr:PREDICTED: uncharacterized protein LOC109242573 [Nicotiana attenuata]OIT36043.1 hypothetical protein A4A49_15149 [Nicotiana attenuata]